MQTLRQQADAVTRAADAVFFEEYIRQFKAQWPTEQSSLATRIVWTAKSPVSEAVANGSRQFEVQLDNIV